MKWVTHCKEGIAKIIALEDTPHAVALGSAIGILFGITPLFGIKMPLAVALSFLLRGNVIATLAIVGLADLFTPALMVVYFLEYKVGCFLFAMQAHPASYDLIDEAAMMPQWLEILRKGLPLAVGSLTVGICAALPTYSIVRRLVNRKCGNRQK